MANVNILESANIDGVQIKDFTDQAAYNTATGTELPATSANKIMTIIGGVPVLINDAGALTTLVTLAGTQTLTNKTLTTPTIGSFANATHDHSNAAGGGTLAAAAIASGQIAIANGGTGQATQTAAMDALSPTTTKGDLLVDDGTNVIRLAAGTNGHVLKAASGETAGVQWAAESGGGAPTDATYITQTANGSLSAEQALSTLETGAMVVTTTTGVITSLKHNLVATAAPTVNEDSGDGYVVGSLWIDVTNDNVYMAVDVSGGAAVWRHLNATGGGSAGLVAIADVTLGSAAASIQFTSIPGTYAHLMFMGRLRSDRASNDNDGFTMVFNSDTTATNYRYVSARIAHNGAAAADINNSNGNIAATIAIPAATSDSGFFASVEMKIMNYSTTGFMRHVQGYTQNNSAAATHRAGFHGGLWRNTANAITQIDIAPLAGSNFIAGSRLTLYGMVDA